ncbi:hypothetical protein [Amycolatopsis sp. EV170708-02-1]|uniref:hypothetical protein n=1 Tax=Amycolatopsis sp. EV170708-02-1 TaxID=2919322 RepID=UPI001F0BB345|nr:hypothetical protein [Amycolatopsis sp. EV170708-02-1]UMP03380.1 hypothetical protein MJQ72_00390 [Amycolatopsis sp. EV170708-02-1]
MSGLPEGDLLRGALPAVVTAAGMVAGCALLLHRRDHRWWSKTVPVLAAGCVVSTLVIWWLVDGVWRRSPDPLPLHVFAWIGVALFGVGLGIASAWRGGLRRGALALAAAALVVAAAAVNVNMYIGQFPTLRAVIELTLTRAPIQSLRNESP